MAPQDDWIEYRKLFEQTLERLDDIQSELVRLQIELTEIKSKNAVFFGFLGGLVPLATQLLIQAVLNEYGFDKQN
jgi:hypothetical protein